MLLPCEQWKLTPKQTELLDGIIETGSIVIAARNMNISYGSAKTHLTTIRNRIGAGKDATVVALALAWDRYSRAVFVLPS